MDLFVYDPATNTLEERGEIVPGLGGEVRPLAVGPDGRIYGTGTRGNRVGLYIYDPKLRKVVKDFGPVGPSHPNGAWSRYVMGVDDTHAYIASGMIPAWYLVAVNLQTGEEKVLLESPTERVMDIVESFPGAWAIVPQEADAPGRNTGSTTARRFPRPATRRRGRPRHRPGTKVRNRNRKCTLTRSTPMPTATRRCGIDRRKHATPRRKRVATPRPTATPEDAWAGNRSGWRASRPIPTGSIP